jgi:ribosomal protein S18 acetylase RimI-like enzyme
MHDDPASRPWEKATLTNPLFRLADPVADRQALLDLNIEYVTWVFAEIEKLSGMTARDILGADVADYVPTVIDKVCGDPPPRGAFYLVENGGAIVAMGGLRRSEAGIAELKRVYVRPAGRGHRLGEALAVRLVADARSFGYRSVRLDTLPFMRAAQALYEAMGFIDCAPYPIEMPEAFRSHIRYMALAL